MMIDDTHNTINCIVVADRFNYDFAAMGVFWFSEDRDKIARGESGAASNKYINTVNLHVNKVAGWEEYDKLMLAQIQAEGYDSIKLGDDWVIFDPEQIEVIGVDYNE